MKRDPTHFTRILTLFPSSQVVVGDPKPLYALDNAKQDLKKIGPTIRQT